ncbi:hypothetical protein PILCRDRAFT_829688 [Piloderma croceum F 1598]|uniref:Uncharacterized protein n=1 Tax=Piloderma croceum (strain F 1598) TaxID=765440 RepID=A0A0C3EIR7_PILCF|nr:hypothetical protein PILCRDRAFT_829688 [Piloderma croceum F 1598]
MPPCHPDAPSPITVLHGAPKTEPQQLSFWFWPNPPPRLAFHKRTAPPPPSPPGTCHHATQAPSPIAVPHGAPETPPRLSFRNCTTPPPPPPPSRLKPSHNGSVLGILTQTPPRLSAPPPPSPYPPHPTASPHRPPLPFHMVHPKPSHHAQFLK